MKTLEVTIKAREAVQAITGCKADSVSRCQPRDGGWNVLVDVIESKARVGDNDLIASYELTLDAEAEVTAYHRVRRYYRTERGASEAA